jgi:hypothetical protein
MSSSGQHPLEPSSMTGLPVVVNVVWIVAHTKVRATKNPHDLPGIPAVRREPDNRNSTFHPAFRCTSAS